MGTTDKQFFMVFTGILVALILLTIGVVVIANMSSSLVEKEKSDVQIAKTIERIKPLGQVNLASAPNENLGATVAVAAPAVAAAPMSGEQAYGSICQSCHDGGLLDAPKFGDVTAWKARLVVGKSALYNSAINGKGLMAPKGGNAALSDDEVKAAVDYMLQASQ